MNQKSLLTEKENSQRDQESIKLDVSRKKYFEGGGGGFNVLLCRFA